MKRIVKAILTLFVCIGLIASISCTHASDILEMDDRYYDTIEELFEDYLTNLEYAYNNSGNTTPYNPRDIVQYFEDGDDVFVVCTYAHSPTDEVYQDRLYVYFVEKTENGYHLEIPSWGVNEVRCATIPLHDDYNNRSDYSWPYSQYHNKCYGFAYKNMDEIRSLYFDGNKMKEIQCINPFTDEPFILCYSDEGKFYNLFEKLFVPLDKRHTLEIK